MIWQLAWRMLRYKKLRFAFTVFGLAALFMLSASQVGLLVGWCNTISAVVSHSDVDIWVMAERTTAWDYGTSIPKHRILQVRNVPGVRSTDGMYVGWSMWQCPDGRRLSVQLIGLDDGSIGGPWELVEGSVESVHLSQSVIVDELFTSLLGISEVGQQVELNGEKATVRGISRGVRTFTASPIVFTAMKTAPRYDKSYRRDDTTFVLAKCNPGFNARDVARTIEREVPGVEALTTSDLMQRSITYWMVETGMGLIVSLTAILGLLVSAVVTSQTLFTTTQDHLPAYATLLAIGFSRSQLLTCVLFQGLILTGCGILLGSLFFRGLSLLSASTPVPLEMTAMIYCGLTGTSISSGMLGAFLSLKAIQRIDPNSVFRA